MSPEPIDQIIPDYIFEEIRSVFPDSDITIINRQGIFSIRDKAYAGSSFPIEFWVNNGNGKHRCMYKPKGEYNDILKEFGITAPTILSDSQHVTDSVFCEIPEDALSLGSFAVDEDIREDLSLAKQLQKLADQFLDKNPDLREVISTRFPNRYAAFIFVPNSDRLIFIL